MIGQSIENRVKNAPPVLIVGAGVAGLSCARTLARVGVTPVVFESTARPGGRVVTDSLDGFLLDRGFQVLLAAYPELDRDDREALDLRSFGPGAIVRARGSLRPVFDPLRRPGRALASLTSGLFSPGDLVGLARLRLGQQGAPSESHRTAAELLDHLGFSKRARREFFRPFFGGVLLDPELGVPASWLRFLFRMFSTGPACLPAGGMGAIPRMMANALPRDAMRYETPVRRVAPRMVELADGTRLRGAATVVATDGAAAAELLPRLSEVAWSGTTTLYFAADTPPIREPVLVLDGTGRGPALHMTVPSNVAPSYAPRNSHLISVSVPGCPRHTRLEEEVRGQLTGWFGEPVRSWRHLRTYAIEHALPVLRPGAAAPFTRRAEPGLIACGDYLATPSINGALASGRLAAEQVIEDLAAEAA